ncbi:GNAT family N-acetyltransferase [Myxosarcina sp. GI1]|uniref:GNAT family N-acetyltransferase n=1 Tax=Myxosarcina sp. GI1 TaxID=1541065 RepID=UPI0005614865|nr:GNAT family N-acetyltransferase [Myxosarcina sp. GI1]
MNQSYFDIKTATSQNDLIIAEHFYQMWLDLGFQEDAIAANWKETTLNYIDNARQNLQYQAFVAEVEGNIVGSVSCQLFDGLYPGIFKAEFRNYGYIWGVYVEKSYRHQGIGKELTSKTIEYLKSIGCTRAVLHASPQGKSLYESLGFAIGNQMHFDL